MTDVSTELAYTKTLSVMFSGMSVDEGIADLAACLVPALSGNVHMSLRTVGLASRPDLLAEWLAAELTKHRTGLSVLWFSLSDVQGEVSLSLLCESRPPRDDCDWGAYEHVTDLDLPEEIVRPLDDFAGHARAYSHSGETERWIAETCIPLAWAGLMVAAAMKMLPTATLLGDDARRRVAVFFSEGDDFFFGEIGADGFRHVSPPNPRAA